MKKMFGLFAYLCSIVFYPFWLINRRYIIILNNRIRGYNYRRYLKQNNIKVEDSVIFGERIDIRIGKGANVSIGKNVVIKDDVYISVKKGATLIIEDDVTINKGTRISSNLSIFIGKETAIAPYCNILDHNHVFDLKSSVKNKGFDNEPIIIKEGVWLGIRVQINKGVTIGQFSVIGANAVVTKNVPSSVVYGGIPAKKIK